MDGIELLFLKWDEMNNKRRAFVLVLGLGALAFAIGQILEFTNIAFCVKESDQHLLDVVIPEKIRGYKFSFSTAHSASCCK